MKITGRFSFGSVVCVLTACRQDATDNGDVSTGGFGLDARQRVPVSAEFKKALIFRDEHLPDPQGL